MWEMARIYGKRLKCVKNDLDIWEMAQLSGKQLAFPKCKKDPKLSTRSDDVRLNGDV